MLVIWAFALFVFVFLIIWSVDPSLFSKGHEHILWIRKFFACSVNWHCLTLHCFFGLVFIFRHWPSTTQTFDDSIKLEYTMKSASWRRLHSVRKTMSHPSMNWRQSSRQSTQPWSGSSLRMSGLQLTSLNSVIRSVQCNTFILDMDDSKMLYSLKACAGPGHFVQFIVASWSLCRLRGSPWCVQP